MDADSITRAATRLPAHFAPLALEFFDDPLSLKGWAVIGTDSACDVRVELSTGRVVAVDPKGELPRRFMNASVTQLSAFVHAYDEYCSLGRS